MFPDMTYSASHSQCCLQRRGVDHEAVMNHSFAQSGWRDAWNMDKKTKGIHTVHAHVSNADQVEQGSGVAYVHLPIINRLLVKQT